MFQHASQNCNFNDTFLITGDEKKEKLLAEMNKSDGELFQLAFVRHCSRLHYNGDSGLVPHRILSLNILIQRMSPTLLNYVPQTDDEINPPKPPETL